jgi:hypothetical protein
LPSEEWAGKTAHEQSAGQDPDAGPGNRCPVVKISAEATPPAPRYMFFDALASAIRRLVNTSVAASSMTPEPAPK